MTATVGCPRNCVSCGLGSPCRTEKAPVRDGPNTGSQGFYLPTSGDDQAQPLGIFIGCRFSLRLIRLRRRPVRTKLSTPTQSKTWARAEFERSNGLERRERISDGGVWMTDCPACNGLALKVFCKYVEPFRGAFSSQPAPAAAVLLREASHPPLGGFRFGRTRPSRARK